MKTIQSIDRAVSILNFIAQHNNKVRLSDIAEGVDIKLTTLHGLIATLEHWGFVSKDAQTNRYALGLSLYELGNIVGEQLSIKSVTHPYLQQLVDTYCETAHLAVLSNFEAIYVDKVESTHPIRMASLMGTRERIMESTVGKVMLSHATDKFIQQYVDEIAPTETDLSADEIYRILDQVKHEQVSVHYHAQNNNFTCIAVCLKNSMDQVVGAINISIPEFRFHPEVIDQMKRDLLRISQEISTKI